MQQCLRTWDDRGIAAGGSADDPSQNQAIRLRIADVATQVAEARSLMFQVSTEVDAGRTSPVSASMSKLFASEMAEK